MQFKNKVVVITGGAHGIGKTTKEAFEAEGALVEVIDIAEDTHFVGDISNVPTMLPAGSFTICCIRIRRVLKNRAIHSSVFLFYCLLL